MTDILEAGAQVPDVTFRQGRDKIQLIDYKGQKNVVVAFYAAAFTGG